MNIIINTEALKKSLHEVVGVVGKDLSMPILSHVLITKEKNNILITGTNLEVQITSIASTIECIDFEDITVPGRKLYEIVRSLEKQDVEISTSKTRMVLKTKNSVFKLSMLPPNNFPTFDDFKPIESFTINEAKLLKLFNKTSFSMATNPDVRFILCGLLLEISPNNITAVATDAHRLAISTMPIEKTQLSEISCIIPRKAVLELMRVLHGSKDAKLNIGNNQISISIKDLKFVSKLMDGKFPAGYKGVIPTSANIEALIDKQNIRSALQRVSILANEKFKGVRVEAAKDTMILLSENPEQEEAKETIEYQPQTADPNKIIAGFNAGYLIEAINACEGEEVIIGLNGPKEAPEKNSERKTKTEGTLIFSPTDGGTKYVVMPYNI